MANNQGSVMFFDLNNLKVANDTFGHDVGDILLKTLASIIMSHNGKHEHVYRHGGDEFLNILIKSSYKTAEMKGRIIKEEFDAYCNTEFNYRLSEKADYIGVSVGCASGKDLEDAIGRADMRMYDHKKQEKGEVR